VLRLRSDGEGGVTGLDGLRDLDLAGAEWKLRGLCSQTDPAIFFPDHGGDPALIGAAKRVCMACEVRVECLQDALDNDERFGIWGGLTERQRRRITRARRRGQVAA
jgi:WhiB family redox-sensing transcriptional regulator